MLRRIIFALSLLVLSGCISTQTQHQDSIKAKAIDLKNQPTFVVYDFALDPNQIKLNRSFTAKLIRHFGKQSVNEKKTIIAHDLAQLISKQVVNHLNAKHLTAIYADKSNQPISPHNIIVKGTILEVDQGNRLHRMLIGFGLGGTKIKTEIQLFQLSAKGLVLLAHFTSTANSSQFKPGIAPMTATVATIAGPVILPLVVSTSINTSAELFATDVRKIANHVAVEISEQIIKTI